MKKTLYILTLVFLAFSCDERNEDHIVNTKNDKLINLPIVRDTIQLDGEFKMIEDFLNSNYRPLYIGDDTSIIYVDYKIQEFYTAPPNVRSEGDKIEQFDVWKKYWDKYKDFYSEFLDDDYNDWDSAEIELIIDTSQRVSNKVNINANIDVENYIAYPVFIRNMDTGSVVIGYGTHIPLILEAKNKQQEWTPLEHQFLYRCVTGLPNLILPSKNIIISSLPITTGDEKVKLRLKLGNNYSNVINGSLDLTFKHSP
jgi:hypothetical protein